MNNDKLALKLGSKLMAKASSLLDAEVRTIVDDMQDTQKNIEAKRTITIKLECEVASDHRGIKVSGTSKSSLPSRDLEPVVYPIDVNNSGQLNLLDDFD